MIESATQAIFTGGVHPAAGMRRGVQGASAVLRFSMPGKDALFSATAQSKQTQAVQADATAKPELSIAGFKGESIGF